MEPRIIRAVISDERRIPVPHKSHRRTVSPATAALLTDIMEQVVDRGTGTRAAVPGFTVAGKTGTAQKVVNGRYSQSDYNASFVGFVPSRQPVFAIVVVVDSPHGDNLYYGGSVAAPIFSRIAEAALRQYGVPPNVNSVPPVIVARDETPSMGRPPALPAIVTVTDATGAAPIVPDLRGLSARDGVRMLAALGLIARINGAGVIVDQDPAPGTQVERGSLSLLRLGREFSAPASADSVGGP
jgi:membrane peptidoglycan carboxypeptidase